MPGTSSRSQPVGDVIAMAIAWAACALCVVCAVGAVGATAAAASPAATARAAATARCTPRAIGHRGSRGARRCPPHRASRRQPTSPRHPAATSASGATSPAVPDAADCAAADQQPTAANLIAIESATLCLVNRERTDRGLVALRVDPRLQGVAVAHSADMIARDYFEHTTPSGLTAPQRILASGYVPVNAGYTIGENIALGTQTLSTPRSIVAAWMNSPGHRDNILEASYRQTGLGALAQVPASRSQGQAGGIYTQEFGIHD
jgi:uncharacterized protein YkwD